MSTIEEQLSELGGALYNNNEGLGSWEECSRIEAAIIADWNAAADLLHYAAAKHIYCRMDYFRCDICQQAAQSAPAICHESYCFVGQLRAHIAKMEGTDATDG